MTVPPKLLFFAGSLRNDSLNKKLARNAARIAGDSGVDATFIDLRDYPLPIYDGDLEAKSGLPDIARRLKVLFAEHDGFFLAAPEYNSSMTGLTKNTLDWMSRREDDEPPMVAFKGKVAALSSASPGAFGGARGLIPLRQVMVTLGVLVIPEQLSLPRANQAFDEGRLKDAEQEQRLTAVVDRLVAVTAAVQAAG